MNDITRDLHEAERLKALRRYDILDTPPDGSFDRIAAIAARLFDVPISIISLVDHDRTWFKAHHGLDVEQIGLEPGLCASAILHAEPWVLNDAKTDLRSLANPLVAGDFGLRFYAGVPLRTSDGFNLGTLCVIDFEPRETTESQIEQLKDLASVVMDQMELRLAARAAVEKERLLVKEIDHRVMNSLQQISSFLRLQARALDQPMVRDQLELAASRVSAIARVHQHIGTTDDPGAIDIKAYLSNLRDDLQSILATDSGRTIRVSTIEAALPATQTLPVGLIINELVTNAIKHGTGDVLVEFSASEGGGYRLSVANEGQALAAGVDPAKTAGLGMKIVAALAHQLGGRVVHGGGPGGFGTKFTVDIDHSQVAPIPVP